MTRLIDMLREGEGKEETKRAEKDSSSINGIEGAYERGCRFVEEVFERIKRDENLEIEEGIAFVREMVDDPHMVDVLCFKAFNRRFPFNRLVLNSMNVSLYSLKVGRGLDYDRERLIELGISALLHEVGMIRLPQELINKEGRFNEEEYEIVKKHPIYGYEMLNRLLKEDYRWIARVILQEHERDDGSGYPYGLSGEEIHEYAKIIGLTDIYDALTQPRPQRKRFFPYDAVKEIIEYRKGLFPPRIIKVLLRELSIFPVMSYVKLNSNEIGRVIETDKEYILRPTIEILYDALGRRVREKKVIRLKEAPFLYITRSLWEDELKDLIRED